MIEFDQVTRTYGAKMAVDGLQLSVSPGEIFAFLGPNGAGKTTSIKMAVGLLRPSQGHIRVCGQDVVTQSRQARRLLGFVPDELFLYDKLSGREFLEFIAGMNGFDRDLAQDRIQREINQFDLSGFLDELTENYSHGMKQRLVFAAAMVHDPEVLILDEPLMGLDPRTARMVKDLLRAKADAGMTIFMSTHTLTVAEEIADRIGIVDRGRLCCVGTLAELRRDLAASDNSLEQMFLEVTARGDDKGEYGRTSPPPAVQQPTDAGSHPAKNGQPRSAEGTRDGDTAHESGQAGQNPLP